MDADAIIIGAGACGLMCAVQAGYLGKRVILLEKNSGPGAKILISGGGRCNYTNLYSGDDQFICDNPYFLKSAFSQWTAADTISFFEGHGVYGKEKTLGQVFPADKNAKDILRVFTGACAALGQTIICEAIVSAIDIRTPEPGSSDSCFSVTYSKNDFTRELRAAKLVIATGGLPIPKMGASDFALRFAKNRGLRLTQTAPALVPLTITGKEEEWYARLSGNSVFCSVSNHRIAFEEHMLFTHWGLSGPAILQISSYWRPGEDINIDFLPHQDIAELIESERKTNGKLLLGNFLSRFFSRKFSEALGLYLPLEKNIASLTRSDLEAIRHTVHLFKVRPAGDKGYAKAEVMRGGIDTSMLSSKTLECKSIKGLYFGGECVDVTGWLGGYNFQWAWASAYVIAQQL